MTKTEAQGLLRLFHEEPQPVPRIDRRAMMRRLTALQAEGHARKGRGRAGAWRGE